MWIQPANIDKLYWLFETLKKSEFVTMDKARWYQMFLCQHTLLHVLKINLLRETFKYGYILIMIVSDTLMCTIYRFRQIIFLSKLVIFYCFLGQFNFKYIKIESVVTKRLLHRKFPEICSDYKFKSTDFDPMIKKQWSKSNIMKDFITYNVVLFLRPYLYYFIQ